MSISIQGSTTVGYSALKAAQLQTQVTLSGEPGSVTAALPEKSKQTGNIAGKLNALEHSNSANLKPMFLKGVLQKLTGIKARDLDIEQMELVRTHLSAEVGQAAVLSDGGYAAEAMQVEAKEMSLAVSGSLETKAGTDLDFTMQISSAKVAALYAAIVHQAGVPDQPLVPPAEQDEPAAQEQVVDTTA